MVRIATIIRWLPVTILVVVSTTFTITYFVAVYYDHIYPFWPYISDTGAFPPESCIFSIFLNLACVLLTVVIYVRHRQVSHFTLMRPYMKISRLWNIITTIIGLIGIIGLDIVANFQETSAFVVHIIGALLCFIFSTFYFLIQCIFTYQMRFTPKFIFWLRVVFTCVNVISFITAFAPLHAALSNFKGKDFLKWSPKDGGYGYHLTSSISEWILVLSFCLYIVTFHWEFQRFEVTTSKIILHDQDVQGRGKTSQKTLSSNGQQSDTKPGMSQWL